MTTTTTTTKTTTCSSSVALAFHLNSSSIPQPGIGVSSKPAEDVQIRRSTQRSLPHWDRGRGRRQKLQTTNDCASRRHRNPCQLQALYRRSGSFMFFQFNLHIPVKQLIPFFSILALLSFRDLKKRTVFYITGILSILSMLVEDLDVICGCSSTTLIRYLVFSRSCK